MKDVLSIGARRWFEYHCFESEQSADAHLWHRSHSRVIIEECENASEFGSDSRRVRALNGTPLVYNVRFADGFVGVVFEDELLYRQSQFCRPAPPVGKRTGP